MQVMCSKGCGHAITVTSEMIEEATSHNSPLNVAHEVCPTDEGAPKKVFRAEVTVYEVIDLNDYACELCNIGCHQTPDGWFHNDDPPKDHAVMPKVLTRLDMISQVGGAVAGATFKLAAPELTRLISDRWAQVLSMADTLSEELPPADEEAVDPGEQVEASHPAPEGEGK